MAGIGKRSCEQRDTFQYFDGHARIRSSRAQAVSFSPLRIAAPIVEGHHRLSALQFLIFVLKKCMDGSPER
jgi:hypothetical protein